MANIVTYVKRVWVDHFVSKPRRYQEIEDGEYLTHKPQFGTVLQKGTPIKAAYMNNLENGVADCADAINALAENVQEMADAVDQKQNALTFDSTPTSGSSNPVTSGGVKAALDTKQGTLTFDSTPTSGSNNPVTSGGIHTALASKKNTQAAKSSPSASGNALAFIDTVSQNTQGVITATKKNVTVDTAPTANSSNPVTSGGVKTELDKKQNTLTFDTTPTTNSTNPVTSGGVKTALDAKATIASPTFTGTPKAPTAAAGTNTTQIATTAFVQTGLSGKQNTLTFDTTPTAGSSNPVTSGGIKTALDNKVIKYTATIPATGWTSQSSGAYYTINLTVSGILSTDTPDIGIVQTGTWATDEAIRDAWACITRIVAAANQLQITADSIPGRAIPIQVRCVR